MHGVHGGIRALFLRCVDPLCISTTKCCVAPAVCLLIMANCETFRNFAIIEIKLMNSKLDTQNSMLPNYLTTQYY